MALQDHGEVAENVHSSSGSSSLTTPLNTNGSMNQSQIGVENGKEDIDEDEDRIRQVMEEAKKRAALEVEGMGDVLESIRPSGALSKSGIGAKNPLKSAALDTSSSDSEDDLMSMDLDQMLKKPNAPLRSLPRSQNIVKEKSPDHAKRRRTPDEYLASYGVSPSKDEDDAYKPPKYATQTEFTPSQRPKREAARRAPYVYKLALQRPSESRQVLLDTRHSAAVKMGIVKPESWKQGARTSTSGELIKKLMRERNKEVKDGIGHAGLKRAISDMEKARMYTEEDDEDEDDLLDSLSEGDLDDLNEGLDEDELSDDDDLSAYMPSPKKKRIKMEGQDEILARFDTAKKEIIKKLETEEEEDEEHKGQLALDILENDRAEGAKGNSLEKDDGEAERNFWGSGVKTLPRQGQALCLAKSTGLLADLISLQDSPNDICIAQLLRDDNLSEGLAENSVLPLTSWLVQQAMLYGTEVVSQGAIVALENLLKHAANEVVERCIDLLIAALRSLGMKDDVMPISKADTRMNLEPQENQSRKVTPKLRTEKILIFLIICQKTAGSIAASGVDCKPLLFCLFGIMVEPSYIHLREKARHAFRTIMDTTFTHEKSIEWDMQFQGELCTFLRSKYPSTKLAYLRCLPCDSLRSRILVRNTAVQLITQEEPNLPLKTQPYVIPDNFDLLLTTLNREDATLNPLWAEKGEGKSNCAQLEASITILQYCFTDLLLQLCILDKEKEKVIESRKRVHDRLIAAGLEELIEKDLILSQRLEQVKKAKIEQQKLDGIKRSTFTFRLFTDKRKLIQIEEIVELLHTFDLRILESTSNGGGGGGGGGGGSKQSNSSLAAQWSASESQTRAKDALQRNAFLLVYTLEQFNFSISDEKKVKRKKEQGKLDQWFSRVK